MNLGTDLKGEKHPDPIISTRFGIQINLIDGEPNASDSIRLNEQSDSKMISESDLPCEKRRDARISILFRI
jgi:hypothetical protein